MDVAFQWAEGKDVTAVDNATWNDAAAPNNPIFDCELWEPGHMEVKHIRVKNDGTLALKYQFSIQPTGTLETNAQGHTLADAINVYYYDPATPIPTRDTLDTTAAQTTGKLTDLMAGLGQTGNGTLLPGESDTVTIVLEMDKLAGNEYQNMKIGDGFDIKLLATQWTYEEDTFDDQYDKDANSDPDNKGFNAMTASATVTDSTKDTVITGADGTKMIVPAGETGNGEAVSYTVTPLTSSDNGFYVAEGQSAQSFEIEPSTNIDDDSAVKVFIKKAAAGLDPTTVHVMHDGVAMSALNTKQDNLTTATEGYWYDTATGDVYIYTKTFSPFVIAVDLPGTKSVGSVEDLTAALADDAVSTIVLTQDLTTSSVVEITKDVTIDGAGHTINSTATRGMWVDADNVSVKLKNLTIKGDNKNCQRGFQVNCPDDDSVYHATVVIENCTISDVTHYAINLCSQTTVNMTIKDSTISGWAAINAYGTGNVITVDNSKLIGTNNYTGTSNDFCTVCLEGDTTHRTDLHSSDYTVTINNSTITATQTKGNVQCIMGINTNAQNSSVAFNNCTFEIGEGCYFGYDIGSTTEPNSLSINGKTLTMPHNEYFNYVNGEVVVPEE